MYTHALKIRYWRFRENCREYLKYLRSLTAKKLVEELSGTHIFVFDGKIRPPRGIDVFSDVRHWLPRLRIQTVLDIGANTGQSALSYIQNFPDAEIYSFEPVAETFEKLQANCRHSNRVHPFRLALGAAKGDGLMLLGGDSLQSRLADESPNEEQKTEAVPVDTVDSFCDRMRIARVNYMKVDAEGGDLNVLLGAEQMLNDQRIDLIIIEAGMSRSNRRHVHFDDLRNHLYGKHYELFGIYNQIHEWPTYQPNLRVVDALFISSRTIESNLLRPE